MKLPWRWRRDRCRCRIGEELRASGSQHCIELAGAIERGELVGTAYMPVINKDLRDGVAAVGALQHLGAFGPAEADVILLEASALRCEQRLRARAIGTEHLRIDFNLGHRAHHFMSCLLSCYREPALSMLRTTRDQQQTRTCAAPPRFKAFAQALTVAPVV